MKLKSESQLLDPAFRKKVIEEILSPENQTRKKEAYKRYQCYKDQTKKYVYEKLIKQFDQDTVKEMSYAMTNIAFVRKVVDKLARVYKYGVEREASGDEKTTEAIAVATKECDVNRLFKKTNRLLKLEKNTVQYIVPRKVSLDSEKMTIKPMALPPYLYDALVLDSDPETAGAYILSDFMEDPSIPSEFQYTGMAATPGTDGRFSSVPMRAFHPTGSDITEKKQQSFIFWSSQYHFTCNEKGDIISEGDSIENPISPVMPIVNYTEDQDGKFYAIGGDDLADGAISINSMLTNINHIAITQGYGQVVMTGKSLPRNVKVGPNKIVILEHNEGEPTPGFEFKTATPPLDQLRALIEMYVALLLTTNNLSTSGVSSNLNGGVTFPSGIAMMIDKAESMEDIEDQRQIFIDNEPVFWDVFTRWHKLLKSQNMLVESLSGVEFAEKIDLYIKYGSPNVIFSETEKLDVMERKLKLKLMSQIDALRLEYPDMTDEQLAEKLEEIIEEGTSANVRNIRDDRDSSDEQRDGGEIQPPPEFERTDEAGDR